MKQIHQGPGWLPEPQRPQTEQQRWAHRCAIARSQRVATTDMSASLTFDRYKELRDWALEIGRQGPVEGEYWRFGDAVCVSWPLKQSK
jgi:hypothetical protein